MTHTQRTYPPLELDVETASSPGHFASLNVDPQRVSRHMFEVTIVILFVRTNRPGGVRSSNRPSRSLGSEGRNTRGFALTSPAGNLRSGTPYATPTRRQSQLRRTKESMARKRGRRSLSGWRPSRFCGISSQDQSSVPLTLWFRVSGFVAEPLVARIPGTLTPGDPSANYRFTGTPGPGHWSGAAGGPTRSRGSRPQDHWQELQMGCHRTRAVHFSASATAIGGAFAGKCSARPAGRSTLIADGSRVSGGARRPLSRQARREDLS